MVTQSSRLGISRVGKVLEIKKPFPLIGHIAFGIIDRGYNNLQVRITSLCPLSCIFCSVAAGPHSSRISEYLLTDPEWLSYWINYATDVKGKVHILFDGIGDPLTNKWLTEFISAVRENDQVESITVETRLFPANREIIEALWRAGVDRLNVSIDTLDEEKGKILTGNSAYSAKKVIELVLFAQKELGIEVHMAPVWIPGLNDDDIEELVKFAIDSGLGGKIPPLGIQKYVPHKHGRKPIGVRDVDWSSFFEFLRKLEEKYGIKLILAPEDYGLKKAPRIPLPYREGETHKLIVVEKGLLKNEYLALPNKRDRVITLLSRKRLLEIGEIVVSRIIRDKDGILIAVVV
ncbi:MAG: radical SAM protein [Fervidicoccaceae archaeon]